MFTHSALAAVLKASVDRNRIAMGDSLSLTVLAEGSADGEPDFALLEPLFKVLNRSVGRNTSIVNGDISRTIKWRLILTPKQEGTLVIPAFELGGARSEPITIEATAPPPPTDSTDDLRVEMALDKSEVFENGQVIVTRRLLYGVAVGGLEMQPFELLGAQVIELGDNQYETTRNGRRFGVYEVAYAVFPREAGVLNIPAQSIDVQVGRRNLLSGRPAQKVRLQMGAETLQVKARPAEFAAQEWLVANKLDLSESWSQLPDQIRLGESLTRTITLATVGAAPDRLPTFEVADIPGMNVYAEPLQNTEDLNSRGVINARQRSVAFVPVKPGLIEIPELVVKWWNSTENRAEEARLPARTIEVLPAVAGSSASAPAAPAQPAVPLPPASPLPEAEPQIIYQPAPLASWLLWANLFWACLVLALIALLLKQRRQLTAMQQVSAADTLPARTLLPDGFSDVQKALAGQQLAEIHHAIQHWGNRCYREGLLPASGFTGLKAIAGDDLTAQLVLLERTLFASSQSTGPDLDILNRGLAELHKQLPGPQSGQDKTAGLSAFYPGQ
nr:BatD family protein [Aliamphritea spongicola]